MRIDCFCRQLKASAVSFLTFADCQIQDFFPAVNGIFEKQKGRGIVDAASFFIFP